MKLLYVVAFILSVGCASLKGVPIDIKNTSPELNTDAVANVGESFFYQEVMNGEDNHYGSVFGGDAYRIELNVKSANKKAIELEYAEFMKPVAGAYGGYRKDEAWINKPAFNKTMSFDVSNSKTINFKNYQFEIKKVENNQIFYKRVK